MTERYKRVQQGVAATGVIVSMLFVGFEIRQNTRAVVGATVQAIADQGISSVLDGAGDADWVRILTALAEGAQLADLSAEDQLRYVMRASVFVRQMQNRFLQTRLGILDESGLGVGTGVHNPFYRTEHFLAAWQDKQIRSEYSSEFVDFMETTVMGIR
jgi:hypothetical protein